jgi:peptide/nickel transport system substrate-binding protein
MMKGWRKALGAVAAAAALAMVSGLAAAQELVVGHGASVTSIDPHFHQLAPNNQVAQYIFDRLVHMDEQQHPIPGLATEWKALDDLTWELKLRKGVKFHDGAEFTAEDVLATFRRVPNVPNSPSSFAIYTREIAEATAPDPYTLRLKYKSPQPLMPQDLSNVNIIEKTFETASTGDFNSGKAAIGTGPFRFVEFQPGNRVVFERNDDYWGSKAPWSKVTQKIITSNPTRVAALLAGDVQVIDAVPPTDIKRLRSDPNVTVVETVSSRVIYLFLDTFRDQTPMVTDKAGNPLPKNPLKDVRVRKALSKAIDRNAIVERIMEGSAIPAGDMLAPEFFGANPDLKPEKYDPEGAKKLLAEAGYKDGFQVSIYGPNDRYVNDDKILPAIGAMWARIGIATKVVVQPWSTYISQASGPTYAYSVGLLGWGSSTGEMSSPLRSILSTPDAQTGFGSSNRGRYSNPQVDAATRQAIVVIDNAKREKLLQAASKLAMDDVGVIPLHFQLNVWALRKGLTYKPRTDEYTLAQFVTPAK